MAPISEASAYSAAQRALTDVYNEPFVREGNLAVAKFGNATVNTRTVVEWFDHQMILIAKRIEDIENLAKSKRHA